MIVAVVVVGWSSCGGWVGVLAVMMVGWCSCGGGVWVGFLQWWCLMATDPDPASLPPYHSLSLSLLSLLIFFFIGCFGFSRFLIVLREVIGCG